MVVIAVAVAVSTGGTGGAISQFFTGAFGSGTAATVATSATAGALGSVASQAVGVATGIQSKFSWNGVAMAAIGGGVGAGLGGIDKLVSKTFTNGLIKGTAGSAISQGIGIATGLQKKFSWAGVAAAGIGGGVGSHIDGQIGASLDALGWGETATSVARYATIGTASAIASAAARTALGDGQFGDNIRASVPDVIGQALGNVVGEKLDRTFLEARAAEQLASVGIKGPAGDRQYSTEAVVGMYRNGIPAAEVQTWLEFGTVASEYQRLDSTLAGGLSPEEAGERAYNALQGGAVESANVEGSAATSSGDLRLPPVVVLGSSEGRSGRSIVTDTLGGAVGLTDNALNFAEEHPVMASVAYVGVQIPMGGLGKKTITAMSGKVGDELISYGADRAGQTIGTMVAQAALRNKWTISLTIAGSTVQTADAGTIGVVGGAGASLIVEVALGQGLDSLGQRFRPLKAKLMESSSPDVLAQARATGQKLDVKITRQLSRRGWTTQTIDDVVNNPHATSPAFNRATGNDATAFFHIDGSYIVKDNNSGRVIQISNRNDPAWKPDPSITNPYIPGNP